MIAQWLAHLSLVLEFQRYAPVICNHCPPPTPRGNSGDNDFSSITALLKALYCGDLLREIALFFIRVNSSGVYLYNITSPALTQYCRSLACTLVRLSPAHPVGGGGGQGDRGTGVTNDWCIRSRSVTYRLIGKFGACLYRQI